MIRLLLFLLIALSTDISLSAQADSVVRMEIVTTVAYDYREDTLLGYRIKVDSTSLTSGKLKGYLSADTFFEDDKIVITHNLNLDSNFTQSEYTLSNNKYIYRSRSGIPKESIEWLFEDLDISLYEHYRKPDTIKVDSTSIHLTYETLAITDLDFSYLQTDTAKFVGLLKLGKYKDVYRDKSDQEIIKDYFEEWINYNSLFRYSSVQYLLDVKIVMSDGREINLRQHLPGKYNCTWKIEKGDNTYSVFNPFINDVIYRAMDPRFGHHRQDLIEYRSPLLFLGDLD